MTTRMSSCCCPLLASNPKQSTPPWAPPRSRLPSCRPWVLILRLSTPFASRERAFFRGSRSTNPVRKGGVDRQRTLLAGVRLVLPEHFEPLVLAQLRVL